VFDPQKRQQRLSFCLSFCLNPPRKPCEEATRRDPSCNHFFENRVNIRLKNPDSLHNYSQPCLAPRPHSSIPLRLPLMKMSDNRLASHSRACESTASQVALLGGLVDRNVEVEDVDWHALWFAMC